jgi:hypothetical protein
MISQQVKNFIIHYPQSPTNDKKVIYAKSMEQLYSQIKATVEQKQQDEFIITLSDDIWKPISNDFLSLPNELSVFYWKTPTTTTIDTGNNQSLDINISMDQLSFILSMPEEKAAFYFSNISNDTPLQIQIEKLLNTNNSNEMLLDRFINILVYIFDNKQFTTEQDKKIYYNWILKLSSVMAYLEDVEQKQKVQKLFKIVSNDII